MYMRISKPVCKKCSDFISNMPFGWFSSGVYCKKTIIHSWGNGLGDLNSIGPDLIKYVPDDCPYITEHTVSQPC